MLKTMQNKATMVLETLQIVTNREGEQLVYRPDREYDLLQVISDAVNQSGFDYSEYVTVNLPEETFEQNLELNKADEYLQTALHLAVQYCTIDDVHYMLDLGADPAAQDKYGMLPAHYAAIAGRWDCLNLLPVDLLSESDIAGRTPLHYAGIAGRDEVISHLLAEGVEVNCQDGFGNTPLVLAARYVHYNIEVEIHISLPYNFQKFLMLKSIARDLLSY